MEDSTTETTRASVDRRIDSYVDGDLEHATDVLSTLWEIVSRDGEIKAPSSTPSSVSPFRTCPPPGVIRGSAHFSYPGRTARESHSLRQVGAHQIDSQGHLL